MIGVGFRDILTNLIFLSYKIMVISFGALRTVVNLFVGRLLGIFEPLVTELLVKGNQSVEVSGKETEQRLV